MMILTNQYKIPFYISSTEKLNFSELAKDIVKNSSWIFLLAYFINSLIIILFNCLPIKFSKIFFKTVISPKSNPVTKAFLFYIYHHGF